MKFDVISVKKLSAETELNIQKPCFVYCVGDAAVVKTATREMTLTYGEATVVNSAVAQGECIAAFWENDYNGNLDAVANMYFESETVQKLCSEQTEKPPFYREKSAALLAELLIEYERFFEKTKALTGKEQKTQEILKYINAHYKEELTNRALGERFGHHPNYVNRLVLSKTGKSLHKYVLTLRIEEAARLLASTNLSAKEVAARVGFCDYNHFLKYFKQVTKQTTRSLRQ